VGLTKEEKRDKATKMMKKLNALLEEEDDDKDEGEGDEGGEEEGDGEDKKDKKTTITVDKTATAKGEIPGVSDESVHELIEALREDIKARKGEGKKTKSKSWWDT
jgi:hypothetical protein